MYIAYVYSHYMLFCASVLHHFSKVHVHVLLAFFSWHDTPHKDNKLDNVVISNLLCTHNDIYVAATLSIDKSSTKH